MTPEQNLAALRALKKEDVVGIECKHAVYTPNRFGEAGDMVTVKEIIHTKDKRKLTRMRQYRDYQRPFWLVNERHRNYTDKLEWQYADRMRKFECAQYELNQRIVAAQGFGNPKSQLRMLARNQYLFGCDISTPALIKAGYQNRWKNLFTPNTVAVLDLETDVVNGDGSEPILASITFKDKCFTAIRADWVKGIANVEEQVMRALEENLGEVIKDRKIEFEFLITDNMGEMIFECIKRAHEWQPDFVTFWNMDYDLTIMIDILQRHGYDLAEVFSDPSVHHDYKYFEYKRGPSVKQKADGTVENLASYDRWHVAIFPASFQFIDAMCVYRQIRKAKGKAPSYGLDYTLDHHLKRGKLYFKTGDSTAKAGSIEWHVQMQTLYKIAYTVYNIFDCVGVEMLDEKTRDLQTQVSILSGFSEYSVFHSNPKRAADKLHFFCLNIGKVAGCVSDQMVDENDALLLGKDDWIVTLPTHLVEDNGLYLLVELPNTRSLVRMYVSDADITSTYPNGEIIMNLSKETTMMELAKIRGINPSMQRLIGINLTGGPANAIEILHEVMGAPLPTDLLREFRRHLLEEQCTDLLEKEAQAEVNHAEEELQRAWYPNDRVG